MKRMLVAGLLGVLVLGTMGCSQPAANPIGPGAIGAEGAAVQPDVLPESHGHRLIAVVGEGQGIVNVSPERSEPGFSVEIQVAVWNTSPNTAFNVKRAVDFTADGVCTSSTFIQFPLPNPGPLITLTTSEGGAGSTHIKFDRPQIGDDTAFDVRFEVSTPDSGVVLRTECFTVSVK
jgi:hypothetical protein